MSNANGTAAAHDAAVTTEPAGEETTGATVEMDDGWTISADTPEALAELIDRKLEQARQAKTDAEAAIKHWTAVAKKAR